MITRFKLYLENTFVPKQIEKREAELKNIRAKKLEKYKVFLEECKSYIESLGLYTEQKLHWEETIPVLTFRSIDLIGIDSPLAEHHLGENAQYGLIFDEVPIAMFSNNGYTTEFESLEDLKNILPTEGYVTLLDYVKRGMSKNKKYSRFSKNESIEDSITLADNANKDRVASGGVADKILWWGDLIVALNKGKLEMWNNDDYRDNIGNPMYKFTREDLEKMKIAYHSQSNEFFINDMPVTINRELDVFDFHYDKKNYDEYFFFSEEGIDQLLDFLDANPN